MLKLLDQYFIDVIPDQIVAVLLFVMLGIIPYEYYIYVVAVLALIVGGALMTLLKLCLFAEFDDKKKHADVDAEEYGLSKNKYSTKLVKKKGPTPLDGEDSDDEDEIEKVVGNPSK